MREVTIKCDLCDKVIEGEPIGYWLCRTDRLSQDVTEDFFHPELDICDTCADELTAKISDLFRENKKKEREKAAAEKKSAEKPKGGCPGKDLDEGKIRALRDAKWTLEQIAEEMGCSTQTIANRLKKMGGKNE